MGYYSVYNDEFLIHHGVKGMRWGIRKDRNRNPNYSSKQRIRDRKLYGRGAERRINKRMNKGESVQSARHNEVVKKKQKTKSKKCCSRCWISCRSNWWSNSCAFGS